MILGACDRSPFLAKPGSKNAVTLLNKFGHCASNEKIIDIGIESTISQQDTLLPYQFLRDPNLSTHSEKKENQRYYKVLWHEQAQEMEPYRKKSRM